MICPCCFEDIAVAHACKAPDANPANLTRIYAEMQRLNLQNQQLQITIDKLNQNGVNRESKLLESERLNGEVMHLLDAHGRFSCVTQASALPGCGTCSPCKLNVLRESIKRICEADGDFGSDRKCGLPLPCKYHKGPCSGCGKPMHYGEVGGDCGMPWPG